MVKYGRCRLSCVKLCTSLSTIAITIIIIITLTTPDLIVQLTLLSIIHIHCFRCLWDVSDFLPRYDQTKLSKPRRCQRCEQPSGPRRASKKSNPKGDPSETQPKLGSMCDFMQAVQVLQREAASLQFRCQEPSLTSFVSVRRSMQ